MFTSLVFTAALAAGQPPANPYYPGGYYPHRVVPAAQQTPPNTLPSTVPGGPAAGPNSGTVLTPSGNGGYTDAQGNSYSTDANGGLVLNGNGGGGNGSGNPPPYGDVGGSGDTGDDEAPTYLLQRTLAQTRLGQIMENNGIVVYGWTAGSYNVSTTSGSNLPVTTADRANEFLLNQNWLHVEKTIDPEKDEFQLGGLVDWILPGSDYRFSLPRGLWNDQLTSNNGGPQLYGIDPFQFYAQAWMPNVGPQGTKVILGRFNTHIGYELVQQVDTPFVSRSYLFQYNPFTHTGVWATTQLNDNWSMGNGFATGSDTFIDPANRLTYLGQLKWAPPEGKTTAAINTVITNPSFAVRESFAFFNAYNFLLTHQFNDKLGYVLDTTYSHIDNVPGTGFTDWYGAANYLIYQVTDNVVSTLRAELFNDTTGFRTGFEGLYTEVTYGVGWTPVPGLLLRPSVRYDHNNQTNPFEGDSDMWTGYMEAIVRW